MAEPTSTTGAAVGLTALAALILGPDLGPRFGPAVAELILTAGGAGVGAMHAMSKANTCTVREALWFVSKWVATALVFTGVAAMVIEQATGLQATDWPAAVAFLIAFLADKWPAWIDRFVSKRIDGGAA